MYHDINRFFLCLALFWFGLAHNHEAAFAQEPLPPRNNGVHMQVGPNTTPDDNANTMRVGPRNNRQREDNRNAPAQGFDGNIQIDVQVQPGGNFWPGGQVQPDNTLPPAYPMPGPTPRRAPWPGGQVQPNNTLPPAYPMPPFTPGRAPWPGGQVQPGATLPPAYINPNHWSHYYWNNGSNQWSNHYWNNGPSHWSNYYWNNGRFMPYRGYRHFGTYRPNRSDFFPGSRYGVERQQPIKPLQRPAPRR